jgi:Telomeric repeat-binding factor 2.
MKEEKSTVESNDNKQLNRVSSKAKSEKPFYKKAWFWIVIVVIIAIGSQYKQPEKVGENKNSGSNGSSQTQNSEKKKEEKTEFNVGDIIAFDGKELTVEKVERNWNSGNSYLKPKDGKEYVKVSVKIENKSETEMNYNVFEFKAEDSNGAAESANGQTYSLPDSLGSGDLVKGGKKSGSMIFEVPAGSSLKLHYQPSFWSNKKVIVNL